MVTRTFTGTVITPDGTTLSSGKIILTPVEPLRADESGVLIPSRLELTITDGDVSGSIVAPAHYAVVVMTDRPVLSFIAHVSDDPGDITFAQLYESRHGTVSVDRSVDELINAAIAAHEAAADPHDQYLTEEAGLGDMLKATYDPDDDGQVERADVADAVDWPDVTNKPTDFPPSVHNHDADYSPIGHNHDSDYAASDHNHDADYSPTGHNHDGDYSPTGHDHDGDYAPLVHSHSNATDLVDGMMSASDKSKLDGIDVGATDDQTSAEILTALQILVPSATQAEMEAGILGDLRFMSPLRIAQAIAALAGGGGGGGSLLIEPELYSGDCFLYPGNPTENQIGYLWGNEWLTMIPVAVTRDADVNGFTWQQNAAGSGGTTIHFGLHERTGARSFSKILDASVSAVGTGTRLLAFPTESLTAGVYYVSTQTDHTSNLNCRGIPNSAQAWFHYGNLTPKQCLVDTGASFGAPPATISFGTNDVIDGAVMMGLKLA